ncbi:Pimeloyl-ACP methyl ester carboxylesterase [Pustulibacterium marinum]|uniref:Pimeloyl-ACP methyl ester carboxylesterase n=1 Tax=Pustulibacterium marinum TaxID=1224947 RepID=A0A1I7H4F4_9FLAO|nr:alpha/beta hydrolase [Pustulibacterium marinum]SFU55585.1 Pimeloyl-ACP methyl ester carboxylesterase [Pustulibacterium marinum]
MDQKKGIHQQSIQIPQPIVYFGKSLQFVSKKLAAFYAGNIFMLPIKFKMPSREFEMDANSVQTKLYIPAIDKEIIIYTYGKSDKKILLSHGWCGRGTQLFKIADALVENGYSTISFDAPAHGKSKGTKTNMKEFIEVIFEIEKQFGPFEAAVGHSLGGMALLNCCKENLSFQKLVTVGSGNVIDDIIRDFIKQMRMKPEIGAMMKYKVEKQINRTLNDFSSYIAAKEVHIPVLVIHDEDDVDVPVTAAREIVEHLPNGTLFETKKLGHRKILGDRKVIKEIVSFITA